MANNDNENMRIFSFHYLIISSQDRRGSLFPIRNIYQIGKYFKDVLMLLFASMKRRRNGTDLLALRVQGQLCGIYFGIYLILNPRFSKCGV